MMTSQHQHSEACCNVPPVLAAKNYATQGGFENINRMKTYITGPSTATSGILVIYDIFGYFPQTLQGADLLANFDQFHRYQVFIPDILENNFASQEWYPPDSPDKKNRLYPYLEGHANPDKNAMKVPDILHLLKQYNPGIRSWGILGYCWGGKIVSTNARDPTPFTAAAQCSPAFMDLCDGAAVHIPMCILASRDEDPKEVSKYSQCLKGYKHIETLSNMVHGGMSARADLDIFEMRLEYERGYEILLAFFAKSLYGKGERTTEEMYENTRDSLTFCNDDC